MKTPTFITRLFQPTLELDQIQATVLRMRPEPYFGTHTLLEITDMQQGRALMQRLHAQVASAAGWHEPRKSWTSIALTYRGLEALGVPTSSLATFPKNFAEGMAARADRLRDRGVNDPSRWEEPFRSGNLHLAVTVFAADPDDWRAEVAANEARFSEFRGVKVLGRQEFGAQPGDRNAFGYKDGISQPEIEGSGAPAVPGGGRPIKAGEFVLGYESEAGTVLPVPQPDVLGRNGTFVVFRKYHSHVAAFNRYLHENGKTEADRELLAAKLVGRWRSGAPLTLAPQEDNPALGEDSDLNNKFTYAKDPRGLQVPLGAHMRRMNPRDSKLSIMTDVRIRRIVRRSTTYGKPLPPDILVDDGQARGLDFIALGVRAIDNVEFLQSEWINSGNFTGLGQEKDPMLGLQGKGAYFTVPGVPPRRVHNIESFNTLLGGEYFFMPGLPAIQWLGDLGKGA